MTVLARSNIGAGRIRRRRQERPGRYTDQRADAAATPVTVTRPAGQGQTTKARRRQAGAPQDEAVYNCECGFVFQALVSTSVGCPHCGGTQAW